MSESVEEDEMEVEWAVRMALINPSSVDISISNKGHGTRHPAESWSFERTTERGGGINI